MEVFELLFWVLESIGQVLLHLLSFDFLIFAAVAGIAASLNWTEENRHLCLLFACLSSLSGATFLLFVSWVVARREAGLGDTGFTDLIIFCEKIIPQLIICYLVYRLGQARNIVYRFICLPVAMCILYTWSMPLEKLIFGTINIYEFWQNNWTGKYMITVLSSIEVVLLLIGCDEVRDKFKRTINYGQAANGRVVTTKRTGVVQDNPDSHIRDSDSVSH